MAPNAENASEAAPKGAIVLPLRPASASCRSRCDRWRARPGFAKSDTSSATIVLDEFNAGAFRNAWRSGREQMVHVDGQLASARVFSMSDRATTSSAPNCS
jgi:hypothetical protein